MKTLYFDCSHGLSGEMIVGALCDLGVPPSALEWELAMLGLGDFHLHFDRTAEGGVKGVKFWLHAGADHHEEGEAAAAAPPHDHGHEHGPECGHDHDQHEPAHDHEHEHGPGCGHDHGHAHDHSDGAAAGHPVGEVRTMIQRSELPPAAKARASAIVARLGAGREVLGQGDIASIVCACSGFEQLKPGRVAFFARASDAERDEPIGAAIAAEFVSSTCAPPALTVQREGVGLGGDGRYLRAAVGEEA